MVFLYLCKGTLCKYIAKQLDKMKICGKAVAVLLFFVALSPAAAQNGTGVPIDPLYRTGQLPNGFTYYIRENHFPAGDTHVVLVQKPGGPAVYHQVWETPSGAPEGIDALTEFLKEQLITNPGQYRPHLQGIIIIGTLNADSVEARIRSRLGALPASVDVLQAQELTPSIGKAMEAKMFTAKPLPAQWPEGYPTVRLTYRFPSLSKEQRQGSGYYAMDFMRFALLYTAGHHFPFPMQVQANGEMVWQLQAPEDRLAPRFYQLAQACVRLASDGITPEALEEAKTAYLQQLDLDNRAAAHRTHTYYIEACTGNFIDGIPLPSAQWRYRFVSQLLPFITTQHQNRFIRGVMGSTPPVPSVEYPATAADSLIYPRMQANPEALRETRALLAARVEKLMFPLDETLLDDLTANILDIDLQLQLDSLGRHRVVKKLTADSLQKLYRKALSSRLPAPPQALSGAVVAAMERGTIERGFRTKMEGVTLWQLSGGSFVYLWPDSLNCGQVYFAAVERNPQAVGSLLVQEPFSPLENSPLEWKLAPEGYLLQGSTTPAGLRDFVAQASAQIRRLTTLPQVAGGLEKQRQHSRAAARGLSRSVLLDTLGRLVFESPDVQTSSYPRAFDYVFTGDICTDSLQLYIEEYLASLPAEAPLFAPAEFPADGMRRGNYQKEILFPNLAQENKYALVYTGVCPYTQEQYVLLQLLQQLVYDASGGAVRVEAVLDPDPIGHYLLYIGYAVNQADAAYNCHYIEQILVDLTAYGPTASQLQKARHTLRVRHKEQLTDARFHRDVLRQYARTGRDFLTRYLEVLQRQETATVRDFVRQIMEYGNSVRVTLDGATKSY